MTLFSTSSSIRSNTNTTKKRLIKLDYPLLPCTHVLIPNDQLKVHAFDYQVETNDGRILSAIGYKTEGFMSAYGQKEIIFILVVEGYEQQSEEEDTSVLSSLTTSMFFGKNCNNSPKKNCRRSFSYEDPLLFFKQLFRITSRSTVEHGGSTKFVGNRGLLGSSAIVYVEMSSLFMGPISAAAAAASAVGSMRDSQRNLRDDGNLAYYSSYDEDCLGMVLLFGDEERDALTTFGHLRLLGLLGHKQGCYPYPYWSELQRPSLFQNTNPNSLNTNTQLSSSSALGMFTGRIFLPPSSTFTHYPVQKRLVLKLQQKRRMLLNDENKEQAPEEDQAAAVSIQVRELPRSENPTILLPGSIDDNADGCYVRTIPTAEEAELVAIRRKQQQQMIKKKKKKNIFLRSNSNKSTLSSQSSSSSIYNELLDDDNRVNNNTLSHSTQQHQYSYYYQDDSMISRDKVMACCFLALVGHSDKNITTNHYRMMEDGFFLYLTEQTWNEFWKHLLSEETNKTNYRIQLTEDMVFVLQWVP